MKEIVKIVGQVVTEATFDRSLAILVIAGLIIIIRLIKESWEESKKHPFEDWYDNQNEDNNV